MQASVPSSFQETLDSFHLCSARVCASKTPPLPPPSPAHHPHSCLLPFIPALCTLPGQLHYICQALRHCPPEPKPGLMSPAPAPSHCVPGSPTTTTEIKALSARKGEKRGRQLRLAQARPLPDESNKSDCQSWCSRSSDKITSCWEGSESADGCLNRARRVCRAYQAGGM